MSATPFGKKSGPAVETPAADFEVLPPEGKGGAGSRQFRPGPAGTKEEAISRLIAYLMDNLIKIPGTQRRVGINPLLDILPIFGDGAAMLLSAGTILEGLRRGVPKPVLVRMGMNVLLNGLVGTVPVVGEAFAFWFRPSTRNYNLLVQHTPAAGTPARKATKREWITVFVILALFLVALGALVGLGFYLMVWCVQALRHAF